MCSYISVTVAEAFFEGTLVKDSRVKYLQSVYNTNVSPLSVTHSVHSRMMSLLCTCTLYVNNVRVGKTQAFKIRFHAKLTFTVISLQV